jgi:hypothetical protein
MYQNVYQLSQGRAAARITVLSVYLHEGMRSPGDKRDTFSRSGMQNRTYGPQLACVTRRRARRPTPRRVTCRTIVSVYPHQGYTTALAGNTLLVTYFVRKAEGSAALVQAVGMASNLGLLIQVQFSPRFL